MRLKPAQILALKKSGKKKFTKYQLRTAAYKCGQAGGLVGGPARAEKLTLIQTHSIAKHAANVRWGNPCDRKCPYC